MGLRASIVGKQAPLFIQNNVSGQPISLANYQGKYVLINFWAAWCGPCRAENPNLIAVYNQLKGKNLIILGVSLDMDKTDWLKAIKHDRLPWEQVSDLKGWQNQAALMYAVSAVPQNFLIDPQDKIIAHNLQGKYLKTDLEKWIK